MALTGEDKEVKIPGSLSYEPIENLDNCHNNPKHTVQQERSRGSPVPNSNGSKSKAPVLEARYGECLKNHVAVTGKNVTDGCGEFMPSGEPGTLEAFNCAACNCHRNFHRKELNAPDAINVRPPHHHHHHHHPLPLPSMNHYYHHRVVEPIAVHSKHWTGMVQPVKIAFGRGSASGGAESSSEELYYNTYNQSQSAQPQPQPLPLPPQYALAKKRYRTKFTGEQKDRMLAFAEKLGWRIPGEVDSEVQIFCAEVGVKRQAFKVWLHNNRSSRKKNLEKNQET